MPANLVTKKCLQTSQSADIPTCQSLYFPLFQNEKKSMVLNNNRVLNWLELQNFSQSFWNLQKLKYLDIKWGTLDQIQCASEGICAWLKIGMPQYKIQKWNILVSLQASVWQSMEENHPEKTESLPFPTELLATILSLYLVCNWEKSNWQNYLGLPIKFGL